MKTYVEFQSNAFPPYEGEEDKINPGIYGKRLAEFLAKGLCENNEATDDIFSEDWGWVIPIQNPTFNLWVGLANYAEYENGFLCFIEPQKKFIKKWFKKIPTEDRVNQLQKNIAKVLSENNNIQNIKWSSSEEFKNPNA